MNDPVYIHITIVSIINHHDLNLQANYLNQHNLSACFRTAPPEPARAPTFEVTDAGQGGVVLQSHFTGAHNRDQLQRHWKPFCDGPIATRATRHISSDVHVNRKTYLPEDFKRA